MGKKFRKLKRVLVGLFRLGLSLFLMLLGMGIFINPAPIPGTDRNVSSLIGILVIGFGGALYKIIGIQAETRIRARTWREEMEEDR